MNGDPGEKASGAIAHEENLKGANTNTNTKLNSKNHKKIISLTKKHLDKITAT